ncbi:myb-like protein X isoform X2 [Microplitis mediator]|uniref:myb-like protein X isoform X2 n=1 Tax=Microplitis mediator TaxID=375433 RepID=UPI002555E5C7|nr:myb-like protein X isoform X2 [Microplitis mediator]
MTGRISLVEQKRLQWAKEREEMARLNEHWSASKPSNPIYSAIRSRMSTRDYQSSSNSCRKPLRASEHYGSTASLKSIDTASTSLRSLDFANTGSMINIVDRIELPGSTRKRSPSLPPIYTKEHHQHQHTYKSQELPSLEVEGSRFINQPRTQKHSNNQVERDILIRNTYEEREGETSGYASDSIEVNAIQTADVKRLLPLEKSQGDAEMAERLWQNCYYDSPDPSLPPSRKFTSPRLGELNRPRWGSIWNQDNTRNDLPPPSWLERGLSRLDHSSQVLVINHDSASSPDSSSTGSTDSKTYLRGQNIPVDAQILQEREARRQKALELQSAIKQQLEEKDRRRKEEKERKLREELEEEERIKRERDKERARFEEEQRKLKEKEDAKKKKEETMREILETAERLAKEKKRQRHQRDFKNVTTINDPEVNDWPPDTISNKSFQVNEFNDNNQYAQIKTDIDDKPIININNFNNNNNNNDNDYSYPIINTETFNANDSNPINTTESCSKKFDDESANETARENLMRLNKDVAIVLTGRLEDTNFLNGNNVKLLNLIVNSSTQCDNKSMTVNSNNNNNLNSLIKSLTNSGFVKSTCGASCSPRIVENRLLTPSKYRINYGRDFGTQTDVENDSSDLGSKDVCRGSKESVNIRRDTDKSTGTSIEEKNLLRSKSQPRQTIETRPRWNANSFIQAWDTIQNTEREGSPLSETYEIEETTSGIE